MLFRKLDKLIAEGRERRAERMAFDEKRLFIIVVGYPLAVISY
jgi:hypothetical protein